MPGEVGLGGGGLEFGGGGPELGEMTKLAVIEELDKAIMQMMGELPREELQTSPLTKDEGGDGGEHEFYGVRTPSVSLTDPARSAHRERYAFAAYDEAVSGIKSAMMVDVFMNEGPAVSMRYTVGERDEQGQIGVKRERVDLETGDGDEDWLDVAAIEKLVNRLKVVHGEIEAGRFQVEGT